MTASFLHIQVTRRSGSSETGPPESAASLMDWHALRLADRACCCLARPAVMTQARWRDKQRTLGGIPEYVGPAPVILVACFPRSGEISRVQVPPRTLMQVSDLVIFIPSISQMCNITGHRHAGSSPSRTLSYVHSLRSGVTAGPLCTRYLTALARAQLRLFMPEPAFPAGARAHVAWSREKLVRQDDAGCLTSVPGSARCTSTAPIVIRVISVERLLSRISFGRVLARSEEHTSELQS